MALCEDRLMLHCMNPVLVDGQMCDRCLRREYELVGSIFVTPSGRRWKVAHARSRGKYMLVPLGDDTYRFGGVKARWVDVERLLSGEDKTWRPER